MATASHKALAVSELLSAILSFSDQQSQSRCATVCKRWSPIALDCLWSVLESVIPLLRLLGGIKYVRGDSDRQGWKDCRVFAEVPLQKDWERFNKYATRVKRMAFSSYSDYYHRKSLALTHMHVAGFSRSLFAAIAIRRRTPFVIPNLTSLSIDASQDILLLSHAIVFFGHLKRLHVSLNLEIEVTHIYDGADTRRHLRSFFEDVAVLSSGLEEIDLCIQSVGSFITDLEEIFERSISCLTSLTRISLPGGAISPAVLNALSVLPSLRSVRFSQPFDTRGGAHYVYHKLPVASFPELDELWLPISSRNGYTSMVWTELQNTFKNLTTLFFDVNYRTSPWAVAQDIFVGISHCGQYCQDLQSLVITGAVGPDDEVLSLRPIFVMPNLRKLTLDLSGASVTDSELEALLSNNGPPLEVLHFLFGPGFGPSRSPTFRILPILARFFPRLRALSLCVDTEDIPDSTDFHAEAANLFPCLERLNFGMSAITDSNISSITHYLCALFASTSAWTLPLLTADLCVPEVGKYRESEDAEGSLAAKEYSKRWLEVRRVMKIVKEVIEIKEIRIRP